MVLKLVEDDPWLKPFEGELEWRSFDCTLFLSAKLSNRLQEVQNKKAEIVDKEGSFDKFTKGYEKFGLLPVEGGILYREWAPAAVSVALFGDFSMTVFVRLLF